jgi:hypothetical protein
MLTRSKNGHKKPIYEQTGYVYVMKAMNNNMKIKNWYKTGKIYKS